MSWIATLELNANREVTGGSSADLRNAVNNAADLRIYTAFRNNEHLDPASDNDELIDEVSEFRTTYLIDGRWAAGIMTTRMPIAGPSGFGPRPSMSYFLYNEDGRQALARLYLDGEPAPGEPSGHPPKTYPEMPKFHEHSRWDDGTNAPANNFVYAFERYRFFTNSSWCEVYANNPDGTTRNGSVATLAAALNQGCEIKVGIEGLCADLNPQGHPHTVFIPCGPGYYHSETGVFYAGTHPTVRVAPAVPMEYASHNWDCGSVFVRTDGFVEYWRRDPYLLTFSKHAVNLGIRWFVRGNLTQTDE